MAIPNRWVIAANPPRVLDGPRLSPVNGHMYYLLEASSWIAAETEAKALGGHLATLQTATEQAWILGAFGELGGVARDLWIGMYDLDPNNNAGDPISRRGEFGWASGQPVTYQNWKVGAPDNMGGLEFYSVLGSSKSDAPGFWNDAADSPTGRAVFGVVETVFDGEPAVVAGPIVSPINGHEYLLLNDASWTKAETKAIALGGHLAASTGRDVGRQELRRACRRGIEAA